MSAAYAALLATSERTGFPLRFRTDLTTHDRGALSRSVDPGPFLWVLREDGTNIVFPGTRDGAGHRAPEFPRFISEAFQGIGIAILWFWWDGRALIPVSGPEEASDLLAQHANRLK